MKPLTVIILLLLIQSLSLHAQGVLRDKSFGENGVVKKYFYSFPGINDKGYHTSFFEIAEQSDGKIVALGKTDTPNVYQNTIAVLARFTSSGKIDSTFANNGVRFSKQEIPWDVITKPQSLALQQDGKIIMGLNVTLFDYKVVRLASLERLDATGKTDSSFGLNGVFRLPGTVFNNAEDTKLMKVFALDGGKLLMVVSYSGPNNQGNAFVRVKANGTIDSTFGVNGIVSFLHHLYHNEEFKGAIAPDGKIVLTSDAPEDSFYIRRFHSNGAPDLSFGGDGLVAIINNKRNEFTTPPAFQADGKIVFGTWYWNDTTHHSELWRLQTNGVLDSSFGQNGSVSLKLGLFTWVANVHVLPDGKLILTGEIGVVPDWIFNDDSESFIARLNADGSRDNFFGRGGLFGHNVSVVGEGGIRASIVQPDGRILTAGGYTYHMGGGWAFLAKYYMGNPYFYNEIVTYTYMDLDGNGVKSGSEPYVPNNLLRIVKNVTDTIYTSSSKGISQVDVDTGSYVITADAAMLYYTGLPATDTSSFNSYFNVDSVGFRLVPIPGKRDIVVNIGAVTAFRPGFDCKMMLRYKNIGTDTPTNVQARFIKDPRLTYLSSTKPYSSLVADTLTFNIGELKPLEDSFILLSFRIAQPPVVNSGDTLYCQASILPFASDLDTSNNFNDLQQLVLGAIDPNDKTERHGGAVTMAEYNRGAYLDYVIRFQNTGKDTAFNVWITDTLENTLDLSTLQIIGASHPYEVEVSEGRKLKFTFRDILLPDSNVNEPKSHGFALYRIKPRKGLTPSSVISNKADIYFDYNLPVRTNTATTMLLAPVLPFNFLSFEAVKQESTNLLNWTTEHEEKLSHFHIERSKNAQDFSKLDSLVPGLFNYTYQDQQPPEGTNFYRIKAVDKSGFATYSAIRAVNNISSMAVNIYPNPSKEKVTLQVVSNRTVAATLQLINASGWVVHTQSLRLQEGMNYAEINMEAFAAGVYFVKVTTDAAEPIFTRLLKQ